MKVQKVESQKPIYKSSLNEGLSYEILDHRFRKKDSFVNKIKLDSPNKGKKFTTSNEGKICRIQHRSKYYRISETILNNRK